MNPVIVLGPPRSGTSAVARLLQENLGFMMDEGPIKKNTYNPRGYYEDHRLLKINSIMFKRFLDGDNTVIKKADSAWAIQFAQWITYRNIKYEKWGFKDPGIIGLLPWVKQFISDPIWIVCYRHPKKIIDSQVKKVDGVDHNMAVDGIKAYKKLVKKYAPNHHRIDLTEHISDSELTVILKEITNGGRQNR